MHWQSLVHCGWSPLAAAPLLLSPLAAPQLTYCGGPFVAVGSSIPVVVAGGSNRPIKFCGGPSIVAVGSSIPVVVAVGSTTTVSQKNFVEGTGSPSLHSYKLDHWSRWRWRWRMPKLEPHTVNIPCASTHTTPTRPCWPYHCGRQEAQLSLSLEPKQLQTNRPL